MSSERQSLAAEWLRNVELLFGKVTKWHQRFARRCPLRVLMNGVADQRERLGVK